MLVLSVCVYVAPGHQRGIKHNLIASESISYDGHSGTAARSPAVIIHQSSIPRFASIDCVLHQTAEHIARGDINDSCERLRQLI